MALTLRQLINRLEKLSEYGKNDDCEVHAVGNDGMIDMDVNGANFSYNFFSDNFIELEIR